MTNDAIPAGWKLVPEVPTEAMKQVGEMALDTRGLVVDYDDGLAVWSAMLAAAPKPSPKGGLPGRGEVEQAIARVQRRVATWDKLGEFTSGSVFAAAGEELRHEAMSLIAALAPAEAIRDGGEGGEG